MRSARALTGRLLVRLVYHKSCGCQTNKTQLIPALVLDVPNSHLNSDLRVCLKASKKLIDLIHKFNKS